MKINPNYLRNMVFGAEDSLVSTTGVLFGLASSAANKSSILVTGLVMKLLQKKVHKDSTVVGGVMLKQVNFFLFLLH